MKFRSYRPNFSAVLCHHLQSRSDNETRVHCLFGNSA